jgi:hypothetical protein
MERIRPSDRRCPGRALPALLLCLALTGCGWGRGEVSGTVRYNGRPLPFGTIQFLGPDGIPRAGKIGPDGTFSVGVPAGQAKVIISCLDEARMARATPQSAPGHGRAALNPSSSGGLSLIPPRYSDWNASGLTVLVRRGKTTQDFALTPN